MNEFHAVVADIREESRTAGRQRWHLALNRTEFRAEPGHDLGTMEAVTPRGTRLTVPVLGALVDTAGEVWHIVEKPLATGTRVTARVGSSV